MKRNVNICQVQAGATVGEECIEGDSKYRYTVTVKSYKAVCYAFRKTNSIAEFETLHIYTYLTKKYNQKQKIREDIVKSLIQSS